MLGFPYGLRGLLVTLTKRFIEYELELNPEQTKIAQVHEFLDVSAMQNMPIHNRGIGQGLGALSVAVLAALNEILLATSSRQSMASRFLSISPLL